MSTFIEIRPVGTLAAPPDRARGSELLTLVRDAGYLQRDPRYYAGRIAADLTLLVGGWAAFVLVGRSWWQVLVAAWLGIAFTHIGFLGHDAGHRQVFRSRRGNDALGILAANLAIGLSFGWWVDKHRRHHLNPNHVGLDPDIDNKMVSFYPKPARRRGRIARLVVRHQVAVICIALPLQAFVLHVKSVQFLVRGGGRHRGPECLALALFALGYAGLVAAVLDPVHAVVFVLVQQGVFGTYFALVVAPNHKGMPIVHGSPRTDFVWRQAATARNVDGGRVVDYLFGGLNHQIEHHLFPSMPRRSLRRVRPLVRDFCRANEIPYTHTSLLSTYRQAFGYLHQVARLENAARPENGVPADQRGVAATSPARSSASPLTSVSHSSRT
ncbi:MULTISPECIES: acyl-CoA desaturase [unclassified Frankia]|uniref:fatty acid desaturase family protein n=1 Tax=unclassified Frankia TaxID=2632575 RepID=UPI0009F92107|nr:MULTISPECIES: acyl-CoA desaturase [unclassified Frankia]